MWEFILPIALLVLTICFKLTVNKSCDLPHFLMVFIEFPVDIMFLATSMMITRHIVFSSKEITEASIESFTIIKNTLSQSLTWLIIYIILMVIIMLFWRTIQAKIIKFNYSSVKNLLSENKILTPILLLIFNYIVSCLSLGIVLSFLAQGV